MSERSRDNEELPDPLELFRRMQLESESSELPDSEELFRQMTEEVEELPDPDELFRKLTRQETEDEAFEEEIPDPMELYREMTLGEDEPWPDSGPEASRLTETEEELPDPMALFEQMRREEQADPLDDLRIPLPDEPVSPPPPDASIPVQPEQPPLKAKEPLGFFGRLKNRFKKTPEVSESDLLPPLPSTDFFSDETDLRESGETLPTPEELFRQLALEQGPELPKLPDLEEFKRILEEEERANLDPDLEQDLSGPERFVPTISDSTFSAGASSLPSFFDEYEDIPVEVPKELPEVLPRPKEDAKPKPSTVESFSEYEPPAPNLEARSYIPNEERARLDKSFFEESSPTGTVRVDQAEQAPKPAPRYDGSDPSKVYRPQKRLSLPEDRLEIQASKAAAASTPPEAVPDERKKKKSKGKRFGRYQLAVFTRQMSVMLKSGIQLHSSIAFAAESDPVLRPMLDDVLQKVESGYSFSNAISSSSRSFDPVYVGLVQAGEQSGRLPEMLARLADVLEREIAIRKKMVATITYPAMLLLVCLLGTLGFIFFVLPTLTPLFRDLGVPLPITTRILLASRDFIIPLIILSIGTMTTLYISWDRITDYVHNRPTLERRLAAIPFRLPVIGGVYEKIVTARVLYSLSTMLDVGITLNQALARSETTAGNALVAYRLSKARFDLADGVGVTDCFKLNELFTPSALYLISAGEEAAKLADMFQYVAKLFDEEVEYALEAATNILEPMIMVVMGLVVGFITISAAAPTIQLLHSFT